MSLVVLAGGPVRTRRVEDARQRLVDEVQRRRPGRDQRAVDRPLRETREEARDGPGRFA